MSSPVLLCRPRIPTPPAAPEEAADHAVHMNPANAPAPAAQQLLRAHPAYIALLTSRYWGPRPKALSVGFLEPNAAQFRNKVLWHMNAWQCGISFISCPDTPQQADVRITTQDDGYWSYLGTDIHHIPSNEPTMCLQGFSLATPDSEYTRVIRHETGHTLGFPHEHMRAEIVKMIDPQRAYQFLLATQGWDKQTVDEQVLTPLSKRSYIGTPADETSIMCYQLPGQITSNGQDITGGTDINPTDRAFAQRLYPPTAQQSV